MDNEARMNETKDLLLSLLKSMGLTAHAIDTGVSMGMTIDQGMFASVRMYPEFFNRMLTIMVEPVDVDKKSRMLVPEDRRERLALALTRLNLRMQPMMQFRFDLDDGQLIMLSNVRLPHADDDPTEVETTFSLNVLSVLKTYEVLWKGLKKMLDEDGEFTSEQASDLWGRSQLPLAELATGLLMKYVTDRLGIKAEGDDDSDAQ